jgi:hypothetical protein
MWDDKYDNLGKGATLKNECKKRGELIHIINPYIHLI